MDSALTQEQRQIRELVAEFVEEMAELGLMGMPIDEEYGGAGLDYHAYLGGTGRNFAGERRSRTIVAAHVSLACNIVAEFGDESQKETYLTPIAEGREIGAFALSEADAGNDIPAPETR